MKERFIKLNSGGLQSCLNTLFTQNWKVCFEPQLWGKAPWQQAIWEQDKESKKTYSNPNKQLG
jgi:hypothetical protein